MIEHGTDGSITIPEAASILGLEAHAVRRLIGSGKLRAEYGRSTIWKKHGKVGERRSVRLHDRDVAEYLERARVKPGDLRHRYPTTKGEECKPDAYSVAVNRRS